MSNTASFLLEIGTEELPPNAIRKMTETLGQRIGEALEKHGAWQGGDSERSVFWGPRRMAVRLSGVIKQTPEQHIERQGPFVDKAFDDTGKALPAAIGFARSCGVEVDELARESTDKGERLVFRETRPGPSADALLREIVPEVVDGLPVPKLMRWGNGDQQFVRPIHWVVCLLDEAVVDLQLKGVTAGRISRGHRFHSSGEIEIARADDYESCLEAGWVRADAGQRRDRIADGLRARASELGLVARIDDDLLDEVNALVEWPQVIDGQFTEELLRVPHEALIACMQVHQKFFPMFSQDGKLSHRFLAVANIESRDPEKMQRGYEKVILPRLSDAAFFFDEDRKRGIERMNDKLDDVVFQETLGSTRDKVERVRTLIGSLAGLFDAQADICDQAARLCKADLMSHMVGEFPELQGIMGHYYADAAGMDPAVGQAIESHYRPRFASDEVPGDPAGSALALADRLDTLVGIFAVGLVPSGNKDPYALRRAAVAVLRICLEHKVDLQLDEAVRLALSALPKAANKSSDVHSSVVEFVIERARNYFEEKGIASKSLFSSAIGGDWSGLFDLRQRIGALQAFYRREESQRLASSDKRIRNILRKNADALQQTEVDPAHFCEPEESALFEKAQAMQARIEQSASARDHEDVLIALSELTDPLDQFFDKVMVMADDATVRSNRLALLSQLGKMMGTVGDLSQLNSG